MCLFRIPADSSAVDPNIDCFKLFDYFINHVVNRSFVGDIGLEYPNIDVGKLSLELVVSVLKDRYIDINEC